MSISDDILEGIFCEVCGEVFDDIINGKEPPGHPRCCEDCK